jgi:four helix bundle protein
MATATEVHSYRDLIAWQKGVDLVSAVYEQTKLLPADERFGLVVQMRRCAVSIPSNIAEGWGRHRGADYIRFLFIARGSIYELSTQAEICLRLGYPGEWDTILASCEQTSRVLHGLIKSVQRSRQSTTTPQLLIPSP